MTRKPISMHVATTTRKSGSQTYKTHLLRHSYREDGKVLHKTLANLSHLPDDLIQTITKRLKGEPLSSPSRIRRALPHGHVAALLGVLHQLGLDQLISSTPSRERLLTLALIVARILDPRSKLATARALHPEHAQHTLGHELDLGAVQQKELYDVLDWLLSRQTRIENKLAKRHLVEGSLVLYDVSSSFYTGEHCTLASRGYNRDGDNGHPQIVYGLLCTEDGCPIAIEVFEGRTSDPATLSSQIDKLRKRFHLERVVLVGDRGLITSKAIDQTLRKTEGLEWISALRSESLRKLMEVHEFQPSLFDEHDLVEIESPNYPGERLVVCRNPFLAEKRHRTRQELLELTQTAFEKIAAATQRTRRPLRSKEAIAFRVGKVTQKYRMGKHFTWRIEEDSFHFERNEPGIAEEERMDGLYVIRTSLPKQAKSPEQVVKAYKNLAKVERAFRCLKTIDLKVRPIFHRVEGRVRAHVFLCMLSYYLEWHVKERLAPLMFQEEDLEEAASLRRSIVAPAQRSEGTKRKEERKKTEEGLTVQSFQNVLKDLGTLSKIWMVTEEGFEYEQRSEPTKYQARVLELLGVTL